MFEWLWAKVKDWTPIKRVTDRIRRADEYHKPHRLTWKYLWNAMLAHLNHKHQTSNALNLANAEAGKLGQKSFVAGAVSTTDGGGGGGKRTLSERRKAAAKAAAAAAPSGKGDGNRPPAKGNVVQGMVVTPQAVAQSGLVSSMMPDISKNQQRQWNAYVAKTLRGETAAAPAFSKGGSKGIDSSIGAGKTNQLSRQEKFAGGAVNPRATSVPLQDDFKRKFVTQEALAARATPPAERTDAQRKLLPCRFHMMGGGCQAKPCKYCHNQEMIGPLRQFYGLDPNTGKKRANSSTPGGNRCHPGWVGAPVRQGSSGDSRIFAFVSFTVLK